MNLFATEPSAPADVSRFQLFLLRRIPKHECYATGEHAFMLRVA